MQCSCCCMHQSLAQPQSSDRCCVYVTTGMFMSLRVGYPTASHTLSLPLPPPLSGPGSLVAVAELAEYLNKDHLPPEQHRRQHHKMWSQDGHVPFHPHPYPQSFPHPHPQFPYGSTYQPVMLNHRYGNGYTHPSEPGYHGYQRGRYAPKKPGGKGNESAEVSS